MGHTTVTCRVCHKDTGYMLIDIVLSKLRLYCPYCGHVIT